MKSCMAPYNGIGIRHRRLHQHHQARHLHFAASQTRRPHSPAAVGAQFLEKAGRHDLRGQRRWPPCPASCRLHPAGTRQPRNRRGARPPYIAGTRRRPVSAPCAPAGPGRASLLTTFASMPDTCCTLVGVVIAIDQHFRRGAVPRTGGCSLRASPMSIFSSAAISAFSPHSPYTSASSGHLMTWLLGRLATLFCRPRIMSLRISSKRAG